MLSVVSTVGPYVGRYCGQNTPGRIISYTGILALTINTDSAIAKEGFSANFTVMERIVPEGEQTQTTESSRTFKIRFESCTIWKKRLKQIQYKHLFLLLHVRNVVNSLSCGLWVWTLHSVDPQSLQKSAYSVTSHTDTQRWHTTPPRVLTYMLLCRHRAWPPTPFCEMLQPNISLRKKSSSRSHKSVQRQDHPRHTRTHTHKQWQPLSSDVDGCHSSKSTNHLHSKDDDDRWCHCLPWAELL